MSAYERRLCRSVRDRWLGGVCGGLGHYFGIDPTTVRVGFVLLSILSVAFPGMLVYCLLWLLIPRGEYD